MSISVSEENKLLIENVPLHYQKFEKVYGKKMQSELPEHGPQDIAINLLPDAQLPAAKLYPMSQDELQLLREEPAAHCCLQSKTEYISPARTIQPFGRLPFPALVLMSRPTHKRKSPGRNSLSWQQKKNRNK